MNVRILRLSMQFGVTAIACLLLHLATNLVLALPAAQAQTTEEKDALALADRQNNEAIVLLQQGKYSEAEVLVQRSLTIRQKILGSEHPAVAGSLNNLANLYRLQGQYAKAEPLFQRSLAIREKALGGEHADVAQSLNNLANLYGTQGQYAKAEALFQRSLAISETAFGGEHPGVAGILNNLAGLYQAQGQYAKAEPLFQRALAIREKTLGSEHPDVAQSLNNLAGLYQAQGQYSKAEPLLQRALAIREKTLGSEHPDVAQSLNNLAGLYQAQGQYSKAEPLLQRALAIREKTLGSEHPNVAGSMNDLANLYQTQGEYSKAEPLLQRALAIREKTLGSEHRAVAASLNDLANLYGAQGQYAKAEPLLQRALAIREKTLGSEHPALAGSLNDVARVYGSLGQYAKAEALFQRSLEIREKALGGDHPDVATSLDDLAILYGSMGQYAKAEPLLQRALAINEKAFGSDHPDVARSLSELARLYVAQGQYAKVEQARSFYERARQTRLRVTRINFELDDDAARGVERQGFSRLINYFQLLAKIAHDSRLDMPPGSAQRDAFVVLEQARSGLAQSALAKSAARSAADDPAAASLARVVQDLRNRRQAVNKLLDQEYGRGSSQRDAQLLDNLQKQRQELENELSGTVEKLYKAFPKYAELSAPDPIELATVQKLLRPGEALVSFFTFNDRLLTWVVRNDREPIYHDAPINREDLKKLVDRVRVSLDQTRNSLFRLSGVLAPYDISGAYELYKVFFAPIATELSGVKQLIIVPDDLLLPLPFGALVTQNEGDAYKILASLYSGNEKIRPDDQELLSYREISWLINDYAITVLPSATSLKALREIPRNKAKETELLIAFGDPLLSGNGFRRGGDMLASRGASVPMEEIRKLDRLPGTRDELLAVARALGASAIDSLYLGERATKPMVTKLNEAGRLAKADVVAFATHGLIAGDLKGLKEPALVLTPPQVATDEDNGLLALEDILNLKLDSAGWVILSACNTAAADGSGEGLSGLARAFFFSGARSLLISHWSVDDIATQHLMTEIFQTYSKDKTALRSEAVRQGMMSLMTSAKGDTAYLAHPFAWAAFFVVGEP